MKKSLYLVFISLFAILLIINNGCVDSVVDTSAGTGSESLINIQISDPVSNDSISYGASEIKYSVKEYSGVNFLQLFVNNKLQKNIVPAEYKKLPKVTLDIDSNMIGSRINFFLVYYDLSGNFVFSDTVKNVLITENHNPPLTPFDFKILSLSETSVNISWKDSSRGTTGYEIFRRASSETYGSDPYLVAEPNSFNINDESLAPGTIYYYKIRGVNIFGKSDFTGELNTIGTGGSQSVPPPTQVTAAATGPRIVKISWQDNSANENYFGIERRYTFSDYKRVGIVGRNATTFTDSMNGLSPGTEYYYRVKAYSGSDSSWSSETYVQTPFFLLKAPTITSLTNYSSTNVLIKWKDNDPQYTYIQVFRRTAGQSDFVLLAEVADVKGEFDDPTVIPGNTYYYKLLAADGTNSSEFSAESSIKTEIITLLPPVISLYYYAGDNKIYLAWTFNQTASKFLIERKDITSNPAAVDTIEVDGSLRTYTDNLNACNRVFQYRIQAVDNFSTSNFSAAVTVNGGCW